MSHSASFRCGFALSFLLFGLPACQGQAPEPEVPATSASPPSEARYFQGAKGCFTMIELGTNASFEIGGDECGVRTLPASTFKIPNALIALDRGIIEETTVIAWDGKERWNAKWNQDLSLPKAMWYSAVPFFQQIATKVGTERYRAFLSAFQYGNADPSGDVTMFWLNGVLQISPREEARFMAALYEDRLPVSATAAATVKRILELRGEAAEQVRDRLPFVDEIPAGVVLSGKTGSQWPDEPAQLAPLSVVGWFVGALSRENHQYVFACRLRSEDSNKIGPAAARIAFNILKEEKFL